MAEQGGQGDPKPPPPLKQKFGQAELLQMLLQMYLTIPVTSATSESTFSALRLLKNYLRSTMKQDCLNNCLLMHCHKLTTGTLYNAKVCLRQQTMQRAFWKIYVGVCTWLSGRTAPPRFKTLRCLWHVSLKVIITLDNQGKMQPWWNICSQGSCLTLSPI